MTRNVAAAPTKTRRAIPVSITVAGSPRRRIASLPAATRMLTTATTVVIHFVSCWTRAAADGPGVSTLIQNVDSVFKIPSAALAIAWAIWLSTSELASLIAPPTSWLVPAGWTPGGLTSGHWTTSQIQCWAPVGGQLLAIVASPTG